MEIINAKVLDPTHVELSRPISARTGEHIRIFVPDEKEDEDMWKDASERHFMNTYDDRDAVYDRL